MFKLIPSKERFDSLSALNTLLNADFDSYFTERALQIPVNVTVDDQNIYVDAQIPGLNKKDINIEYKDNYLTISAEKADEKKEEGQGYYYREIRSGSFCRTINIGTVDFAKADAQYENGILKVTIPKSEDQKPRKLTIK